MHRITLPWRTEQGRTRFFLAALLAILIFASAGLLLKFDPGPAGAAPAAGPSKVIVLGFDGADARLVRQWMDEGKLPNLDRLRRQGTYSPLMPPNPPQTPVSWSTFTTGMDPGKHEIFDFLKRNPDTYAPDFAMMTPSMAPFLFGKRNPLYLGLGLSILSFIVLLLLVGLISRRFWIGLAVGLVLAVPVFFLARAFIEANIPVQRPFAINNRKGATFWQLLSDQGIHSTVIRVPQTFPPDPNPGGRLLSGLGVPDLRGTFGTYTLYTSEPKSTKENTEKGGKIVVLEAPPGTTEIKAIVYGPFNKLFGDPPEILLPLKAKLDWNEHRISIQVSGQTIDLKQGEWSDFVRFEFPIRKLIKVHGIARFYLLEMGPRFKLYLSALNFDPLDPVMPITYPKSFAREIYNKIGLWKTLGWALDTWAFDEEVTDEEIFSEDLNFTVGKFEQIMDNFMNNPKDRLYVQIYYFTDRAGHMFWRFIDPENPAYDPEKVAAWGDFILKTYQRMDAIVGKAMDHLPPDGVLLVCSDHGFATWRHSFNMNTWLVRNGFMGLKGQDNKMLTLDDLFVEGTFWQNVDWSRTQAYALGLGGIYINVLGRERDGIVSPGPEYERVCREIKEKLEAFVDPATGEHPVYRVYRRDEMYKEFNPDLIPDLRAGNNLGYRVSWQTSLGGVPRDLFETHKSNWSGDHCSLAPELVPGVVFCNRPLDLKGEPNMRDICPTILALFSVPSPANLDGRPLPLKTGS
jgi:predicted AlkP superfamily phosphohydrolase/phosphomutase